MSRLRAALALASISLLTGGCAAAAIPVVAGGMIARDRLKKPAPAPVPALPSSPPAAVAEPVAIATPPAVAPSAAPPRLRADGGERAASSLQAYQGLWTYLSAKAAERRRGAPLRSVVLRLGATLEAPAFEPCGAKPLAVIVDLDDSDAGDVPPVPWLGDGNDGVTAAPGAVDGVEAARREGIAVLFSTARPRAQAAGVVALLDRTGFGAVAPGTSLFLRGDNADPSRDDPVRNGISEGYCVIALVGDALGDFSDLFDSAGNAARRPTAATETMVAPLWGAGWFLLPTPLQRAPAPSAASDGEK